MANYNLSTVDNISDRESFQINILSGDPTQRTDELFPQNRTRVVSSGSNDKKNRDSIKDSYRPQITSMGN